MKSSKKYRIKMFFIGKLLSHGVELQFCKMQSVLEMDSGDGRARTCH